MGTASTISIEVVAALPERQQLVALQVPPGTTARAAVRLADIERRLPGLDAAGCDLAVWGNPSPGDRVLSDGDRVEILRPLAMDPRDARRRLAREGGVMGVTGKADD